MSQENVEIVKRALAEFQRGNFWVPEFFEPDVRIRWLDAVGAPSETVGLQDMSTFMLNWLGTFDNMSMVAERALTPETRSSRSPHGKDGGRLRC